MDNNNQNDSSQWMPTAPIASDVSWQADQHFNLSLPNRETAQNYDMYTNRNQSYQGPVIGLQALFAACTRVYPDQPNPLQVTAKLKYWLGGPDPLDYISMYWNAGHPELEMPPHWHYISFGLSDLHGDGRVHPWPNLGSSFSEKISGLGLELSFRMIGEPGHPPTWPAALLQRLATYVFRTGNRLYDGDHISWHSAIDGSDEIINPEVSSAKPSCSNKTNDINGTANRKRNKKKSKIRHMLVAKDPQLGTVDTPLGKVEFVQIVGITDRELLISQRSGGHTVLKALMANPKFGGIWLVTDLDRRLSVPLPKLINSPSDLSGVAANCKWENWEYRSTDYSQNNDHRNTSELPINIKEQIKSVLQKGLTEISLHSKDSIKQEIVSQVKIEEINSNILQSEKDNANECKMSTDSIKLEKSASNSHRPFQKITNMSTDSFEMSKMGAALSEDIANNKMNNLDRDENLNRNDCENRRSFSEIEIDSKDNHENEKHKNVLPNINQFSKCDCHRNAKKSMDNNEDISHQGEENCIECAYQRRYWENSCISLPGVHLIFDREAGNLLLSALRCRILYGRHFTWTAVNKTQAITFVASSVSGSFVTPDNPIVANNGWLQILISDTFAHDMIEQLETSLDREDENDENEDSDSEESQLCTLVTPMIFTWSREKLKISILNIL